MNTSWDTYGSVMWRYMIPNTILNIEMKIYKPLHSYPTLTYERWVLLRWETHAKVQLINPFGSMGHRADRARGSDGPNHKGLSNRVGGNLKLGCSPPRRRKLQNQTKGRWHSGSCGENKSYKGVNSDKNPGPSGWRFYEGLTLDLSKRIQSYEFLKRISEEGDKWWWHMDVEKEHEYWNMECEKLILVRSNNSTS